MGFSDAISTCLKKYFTMSGRAPRSEYWWFILATIIVGLVAVILDAAISGFSTETGPIETIANLLLLCPTLTAAVRRLHDAGRSGWYVLAPLLGIALGLATGAAIGPSMGQGGPILSGIIIILGFAIQLWWLCQPSQPGPNQYGPNPLEVTP